MFFESSGYNEVGYYAGNTALQAEAGIFRQIEEIFSLPTTARVPAATKARKKTEK